MSLPKFPDNANIDMQTALGQILSSIAYEELGLSHIINAEGEKLQYILGTLSGSPELKPTVSEVLEINKSVRDSLNAISHNQIFLNEKMGKVIEVLNMPSSDANLLSLAVEGYQISPTFNQYITNYSLTVPSNVSSATIVAVSSDPNATITGTGLKTLVQGLNTFNVTVKAENNKTKTYTIAIIRSAPLSNNTSLSSLKVTDIYGTDLGATTINGTNYTVTVPFETDKAIIVATAENPRATVGGQIGNQNLVVGANNFVVTVTAEDGTVKNYQVTITREAGSSVKTLSSLRVTDLLGKEYALSTPLTLMTDGVTDYILTVPNAIDEVIITATASDKNAIITGQTGNQTLIVSDNVFKITVTAQNGDALTYTVTITRLGLSTDTGFETLTVTNAITGKNYFVVNTGGIYTVKVKNDVSSVRINMVASDPNAIVSGDTGVKSLASGENPFAITITAQDGVTKNVYLLIITRAPSTLLVSLAVGSYTLTPTFSPTTLSYNVTVPYITNVTISAETSDKTAAISGTISGVNTATGSVALTSNVTTATIRVSAEFATDTIYTIAITRAASLDLKTLKAGTTDLSLQLNSTKVDYATSGILPYTTADIDITATAIEPSAVVSINGVTGTVVTVDLKNGANVIPIKVTVGTNSKNYTLTINKDYQMDFYYTGDKQTFIAPQTGTYSVDLSGAEGGRNLQGAYGGAGGRVKGEIYLTANDTISVYVGGMGNGMIGGYNGGGSGSTPSDNFYNGGSGGGATDIRIGGETLFDRVMVASGGGGGATDLSNGTPTGGYGGGLTGGDGQKSFNSNPLPLTTSTGATQTSGGSAGVGTTGNGVYGTFGVGGGNLTVADSITGGGGGYYGGGTGGYSTAATALGSGGSSYISGHDGCIAITGVNNLTPKSDSVHFSGKVFANTFMFDGEGYAWTTERAAFPVETSKRTGHGRATFEFLHA